MTKILKSVLLLAATTLAVACAKEKPIDIDTPDKINVSIDGIMGAYSESPETKVGTKAEIQTVARLMWNEGDKVYAYDGTSYLGVLTASIAGTDGTYAKLSGSITSPSGQKPITLVYSPLFAGQPTVTDGNIALDFSHQAGVKVPFLVYSVLPAKTTAEQLDNNYVAKFSIATAIYKCNIAGLPQNRSSISEIRVTKTNTVCNLQLSDSEEPVVTGSAPGVISRTKGISAADQRAIATIALVPSAASERKIEVSKGYVYSANFSSSEITPAKSFSGIFAFDGAPNYIENGKNLGKSIAVLGNWKADGTLTTLYWAPVNCGYEETGEVNTEYDHRLGKLYQWGAGDSSLYIDPHVEASVLYYDTPTPSPWYNAKAFEAASKPGERWLSDRGPCPDGWRLPTLNEFKVLCASHPGNHGWVEKGTYAGQVDTYHGAEFFGANADKTAGKGVFFPAAGYRRWQDGTATYFGSYGDYWASTPVSASTKLDGPSDENEEWWKNLSLYEDANGTQTYVYFLEFDKWPSGTTHLCPHAYGTRSLGYSVRCVAE